MQPCRQEKWDSRRKSGDFSENIFIFVSNHFCFRLSHFFIGGATAKRFFDFHIPRLFQNQGFWPNFTNDFPNRDSLLDLRFRSTYDGKHSVLPNSTGLPGNSDPKGIKVMPVL